MDFTFQVTSETIMSIPNTEKTYAPGEWAAKNLQLATVEKNDDEFGGGHTASIVYHHSDSKATFRPVFRFKDEAMIAKPGMEPKNGKFSQADDGKWVVREERPEWNPSQEGAWICKISVANGGDVTSSLESIALKICQLMCESLKVNKKKVEVRNKIDVFGDYKTVAGVELRIANRAVAYEDGDVSSGKVIRAFADYPLNDRDTLTDYIIQPNYPLLRKDPKSDGHYIFSIGWKLRMAVVGEPRPEQPKKTDEEKDQEALNMFAPSFALEPKEQEESEDDPPTPLKNGSAKRPLDSGETPPAPKKAKSS